MQRLKAGVGRAEITPPVGIEMGMWALRTGLCQGVHDPMYARALVLDDGITPAALVSVDVCAISLDVTNRVRELVAAQVPIPEQNILLNAYPAAIIAVAQPIDHGGEIYTPLTQFAENSLLHSLKIIPAF